MGEVYRARDARLKRDVAIKVLPDHGWTDADRLARLEREAQLLAALNHPCIAQIYGLEAHQSTRALVMEFVEGQTLAERIASGPIAIDEVLAISTQIADALASAHERGIVHRDLKPANIKLRADGSVKVLDFGLAKAVDLSEGERDATTSPTISSPAALTAQGVMLGTAAYMAPEQARGAIVDKRADIWAFGCVLFEMLTRTRAFGGDSVADTVAQVMRSDPDWERLPADVPPSIHRVLRRCLRRDPSQRLQDIGDARLEIAEESTGAGDGGEQRAARRTGGSRIALTMLAAAAAGAALAAVVMSFVRREPPALQERRVDVATPASAEAGSFALSPDGSALVFVAPDAGRRRLWLRSLTSGGATVLKGTDGASLPFWAPGGASIGFFSDDGSMKRIDVDSGAVRTIASAPLPWGASWGADDTILFVPHTGAIARVSASGGKIDPVTTLLPGQALHAVPFFLPDGRHFVYYVGGGPETRGVYIASLDDATGRRLVDADGMAAAAAHGHLLFMRGTTLLAQPFDVARGQVAGAVLALADAITVQLFQGAALSASAMGDIAFRTSAVTQQRQFIWFDRGGRELQKVGEPDFGLPLSPSLSRDGRRIAMHRNVGGNVDIWVIDVDRGVRTRVTSDPANDIHPIWSPDGGRLLFASNRSGSYQLFETTTAGPGNEKPRPGLDLPADWSADGRTVLMGRLDANGAETIWAASIGTAGQPFLVAQTPGSDVRNAQFSPDAKWVAYESNESGRSEVYVQRSGGPGPKTAVSVNGGAQPRWRGDGRELFFIGLDERLMAAPIELPASSEAPHVGAPSPLFATHVGGAIQRMSRQQYFVSPDGQRFLMNSILDGGPAAPITLVLNWRAGRARRAT